MGRKIADVNPTVVLKPAFYGASTHEQARRAGDDLVRLVRTHILPHQDDIGSYCRSLDIEVEFETDAVCEHCGYRWTEDSAEYNGGCCGKDEANNPERLKEFYALAEAVSDGTFNSYNDGRAGRTPIDWPSQLGTAVCVWLDAQRPDDSVARLLSLAKQVTASDWCTIWEDPGPAAGQASLPRQPDRAAHDERPERLAGELLSLLDDMDVLPATSGAAA